MTLALLAVAAAAVCSGSAAVLQAYAVTRLPTATAVSAGFVVRLARSPYYLLALALVALGFVLSIVALRSLPLFVVQAGRASSLAITAVLSVLVLRTRLRVPEVVAVIGIGIGLVVVALTAGPQQPAVVGTAARFALLGVVAGLALAAAATLRIRSPARAGLLLAVLAGCCFGVLALGARLLQGFAPATLLADPAAWAMGGAGVLGLLLGALALQRASVVGVTAAMVATETLLGAVLGMLVCGDRPSDGLLVPAAGGFVLVLAGALALAWFGAPAPDAQGNEEPAALPIG
jgi:drug/metabolite transporter (DMT)-like permease